MTALDADPPQGTLEAPVLTILVPFFRDDANWLVRALTTQNAAPCWTLILYDDGSQRPDLTRSLEASLAPLGARGRLLGSHANLGRAAARNALLAAATTDYVLFLDADMLPPDDKFIARYLDLIAKQRPDIAFGGFESGPEAADTRLHAALARTSDSLPAVLRQTQAARTVCTSNLLVRREVLEECPFDVGYVGWGWEDVDWGFRAARTYSICHIDNPALHLGLDTDLALITKFARSGPNFARLVTKIPEARQQLPLARFSHALAALPAHARLQPLLKALALDSWRCLPLSLRLLALKLFRASVYAEALSS